MSLQEAVSEMNKATACIRAGVDGIQSHQAAEQDRLGEDATIEDYALLKINDARRLLAEAARALRRSQQSAAKNKERVSG